MQLQQLTYILEVAKEGSMNKAAQNLFLSQPNLSQAISNLEHELGVTIFKRHNKGVSLTAEGKVIIQYARSILGQVEQIKRLSENQESEDAPLIKISQSRSFYLSEVITNIYNRYHDFQQYSVNITGVPDVIKDVIKMRSEIGFLVVSTLQQDLFEKMIGYKELEFVKLGISELCLVVGKNSSLLGKERIKVTEFSNLTHVGYMDESNITNKYSVELDENWLHFNAKSVSVTDLVTIREMLHQMDAYTFDLMINTSYLKQHELTCIPFHDEIKMNIGYVKRNDHRLSIEVIQFLEEVKKFYGYKL